MLYKPHCHLITHPLLQTSLKHSCVPQVKLARGESNTKRATSSSKKKCCTYFKINACMCIHFNNFAYFSILLWTFVTTRCHNIIFSIFWEKFPVLIQHPPQYVSQRMAVTLIDNSLHRNNRYRGTTGKSTKPDLFIRSDRISIL